MVFESFNINYSEINLHSAALGLFTSSKVRPLPSTCRHETAQRQNSGPNTATHSKAYYLKR